jgi:phenylacetate-coenzyme A ligase PaaK-like adenylate-forming protein
MNVDLLNLGVDFLDVACANYCTAEQIDELQRSRLEKLVSHAKKNSGFYRVAYERVNPSDFEQHDLPVIHKRDLMENFDSWVCDPRVKLQDLREFIRDLSNIGKPYLDQYAVWESSGSSGSPTVFLQDAAAMSRYDSLEFVRKSFSESATHLFDPFGLSERIAFVGAVGHFASNVTFERMLMLNPFRSHSMTKISIMRPMEEVIEELLAFSPTIIATYPTTAVLLAEQISADFRDFPPTAVWTGGETLSGRMRLRIEKAFKRPVRNSYGAAEFLPIAWECEQQQLHINSDWVILEAVDENYNPVPNGTLSHTSLITNLANFAQPIIRVDLGDSIRYQKEPCACGSPLPCIDIHGRADDIVRLENDDGKLIGISPLALTTALEEGADIFDFRLIQKSPTHVLLQLPCRVAISESETRRCVAVLKQFLASQHAHNVTVTHEVRDGHGLGLSGKLKRIIVERSNGALAKQVDYE